jgi:formylmethanofuran dehydrogenase subunit C
MSHASMQQRDVPKLSVGGRFKGFQPEEEKASRKAEVQESEAVRQMKVAWKAWRYSDISSYQDYRAILPIINNLQYTAKDVEGFSIALVEFQDEDNFSVKAGLFLSAVINSGNDSNYEIHTQHLKMPPDVLGYNNEKNIVVNGDVGYMVGGEMRGGSITVNGDAGSSVGEWMNGGNIVVNGNGGHSIGEQMRGGCITIKGNVGSEVGSGMEDGNILINEDAGSRVGWEMEGGSITIDGNVGWMVGDHMKNGSITVKGNAGCNVGDRMENGLITINGNVDEGNVGFYMGGGRIIINGNAGYEVGCGMGGGEIRLEGDYDSLTDSMQGGRIYHKTKLVITRG